MNDISSVSVNQTANLQAPNSIGQAQRAASGDAHDDQSAGEPARVADSAQFSEESLQLSRVHEDRSVRLSLVEKIKQDIEKDADEFTRQRISQTVDRLLVDLRGD